MALVQPSLILPIAAITPNTTSTIKFNYGAGNTEIVLSSKISIYANPSDTTPVVTSTYNSTTNTHVIAASVTNALTVQRQYYMSIQTYTGLNATGNASAQSTLTLFWTLNRPSLTIVAPSTDVTTKVNTLYVEANYDTNVTSSSIPVDNKLSFYSFQLLKGTEVIYNSGNIIGEGTLVSGTTYSIKYNFNGLSNGNYTLQVTATSNQNMTAIALRSVTVETQIVSFKTATVINNVCNGYITVECNITNIDGKTNGIPKDGYIQLIGLPDGAKGYITWDNGYNLPSVASGTNTFSNYTMQIWGLRFTPASHAVPYDGETNKQTLSTNTDYVVQLRNLNLENNNTSGEIDIYIISLGASMYRADLYVYPYGSRGDSYNISKYIPSNEQRFASLESSFSLWMRSKDGEYEVQLHTL